MRRFAVLMAAALAACTVGPDYKRPPAPSTAAYKEIDGWKPAAPREAASGTSWWSIYDDPVLNALEDQVAVSNQTVKADEAAFRESSAIVAEARAGYYPVAGLSASGTRTGQSIASFNNSGGAGGRGGGAASGDIYQNFFTAGPSVSWAPDIWGRIRRTVESDVANAQASAADLAAAQLSFQGTLAIDYFELRAQDEQIRVLERTVKAYQQTLDITRSQFNAGYAAETDVVTAQAQLQTAQAQLIGDEVLRATLEHAIAVLLGKPPSELSIAPAPISRTIPVVPAGVPSALLERRPDVAAAERAMASANALIGVAIAAYYPDLTLSASAPFASSMLGDLLSLSNAGWSIGASASETVFNGGLFAAQVAAARAVYDQQVANYRETVLSAFQQVEDELSSLRILEQQAAAQDLAVTTAERAVQLTLNQYQAGTVAYTAVITEQTIALGDEQAAVTILGNRLVASASLIEALGGGWDRSDLPAAATVKR